MTGDIKLAQEQLRHTQMSTTSDTYVHVERKVSERASEALAKAIAPSCVLTVPNGTELMQ